MVAETVHYLDEEPVTYLRWEDRVMLEGLKHALGLTIREVYPMLQRMLISGGAMSFLRPLMHVSSSKSAA